MLCISMVSALILITLAATLYMVMSPIIGAVVSNVEGCATIGTDMLKQGGSTVDAAIATLICEGVLMPQFLGIGGGFSAIIYNKSENKIESLIARERAPAAAHKNLLVGPEVTKGAILSAVPGEILGYWEMHQRYGRLPWSELFKPTIELCRNGHSVSTHLEAGLVLIESDLRTETPLREIFLKDNGDLFKRGDQIKRLVLAKTFERIAKNGAAEIYNGGKTGQMLVKDIQEMGGIITLKDLKDYRVTWDDSRHIRANITGGYTLYSTPLPSNGAVLVFILNLMHNLNTKNIPIYYQRIVESFKHAFGQRGNLGDISNDPEMQSVINKTFANLIDPEFAKHIQSLIWDNRTFNEPSYYGAEYAIKNDYGTANIAVIAANGDAITVTSSLNNYFGSRIRSRRTGIILNDQLHDFSVPDSLNFFGLPPSPANFIEPGKRPISSMCPSIILDANGKVRLLIGAAGGTKILTSVSLAILKYLVLKTSLSEAINKGHLHHQLQPMELNVKYDFPLFISNYLSNIGHTIYKTNKTYNYGAVTAIGVRDGKTELVYAHTRGGSTSVLRKFSVLF